ncbi:hypothetical protein [Actinomyces minihominis]|uniref:hypothetical protein n=1 Tax=Actinomyces minihominis TaxID=2002838 RepID=UPI000C06CDF0|nr:hypothetical protein [Actinomyces minihominis]
MNTEINLTVEAKFARDLARLTGLVDAGVVTGVQAGRIAMRLAERTGAVLGALRARVLVDLHARRSDV